MKADFLKVPSDGLLLSLLVGWRTLFGWVVLETEVGSVVSSLIGWRQGGCFRLYIECLNIRRSITSKNSYRIS